MNLIIQFFIRTRDFFLFLVLFAVSLGFVFSSNYYSQSAYINSANAISGNLYAFSNYWSSYFHLRTENEALLKKIKHCAHACYSWKTNLKTYRCPIHFR